jgi:hypothetical protein
MFKKGNVPWNKGKKHTKEHIENARLSKIGKKRPLQSKKMKENYKNGNSNVGIYGKESNKSKSKRMKRWYVNNDHPKGMLGKKHKRSSIEKTMEGAKKMWNDKNHRVNSKEYRQAMSDRAMKQTNLRTEKNSYSRCRQGRYDINGVEIFFRSSWEANYALYLDFLIKQKQIKKWEYEKETFWFENIKRGVRSYKPDFKVYNNNTTIEYHEVKGWMDSKSKTKLKRMTKYYPEISVVLIDAPVYKDIKNKVGKLLKFY